jgi:hypothetical protein
MSKRNIYIKTRKMNIIIEIKLIMKNFFKWPCITCVKIAHYKIFMIFVFKRPFYIRTLMKILNYNSFTYTAYIRMSGAAKKLYEVLRANILLL